MIRSPAPTNAPAANAPTHETTMRSDPALPSLLALRAFEAVGRSLSFRKAGDDLLISQSAVSHHIARLEQDLGAALFVRHARGVAFTPAGEQYYRHVRDAFAALTGATAEIRRRPSDTRTLRLSVLPSFARFWLLPRLAEWATYAPDIQLDIDATLSVADIAAGDADVALRYGDGPWPGVHATLLFQEHLTPMASPALLAASPPVRTPADLMQQTLLTNMRQSDWQVWARAQAIDLTAARWLQLTDYALVLQAAQDGLGVAMGRLETVAALPNPSGLTPVLPALAPVPGAGYWMVTARRAPSPALDRFLRWCSTLRPADP